MSKENKTSVYGFLEKVWTLGSLMGKVIVLSGILAIGLMVHPAKVLGQKASDSKIVTFEVPGAGKTAGTTGCGNGLLTGCYGTTPMANNNWGEIVEMYITDSGVYYGFLRAPDGKVTSFSAPGADTTPGDFNGTYPLSINSWGAVTGLYQGTSELFHGFIREANGKFVEVDDPEAGTSAYQGTWPTTINDRGDVAGFYYDANNGVHGFMRSRDGEYRTIDDPNGSGGTMVALEQGLNSNGDVVGWYFVGNVQNGFVREPDSVFKTIEPSTLAPYTYVGGINCGGATTGYFGNSDGSFSGYLRKPDGRTAIFNVPGLEGVQGTAAFTLNAREEITGVAVDTIGANHGFVRFADERIKTFDAENSGSGNFQGTRPTTINDAGQVIGYVLDSDNVSHGFIRSPEDNR